MTIFIYNEQWFNSRLHQNVVSVIKTLNPYCFGRHSYEMSTRCEHLHKG